jgi:hypothetical protein
MVGCILVSQILCAVYKSDPAVIISVCHKSQSRSLPISSKKTYPHSGLLLLLECQCVWRVFFFRREFVWVDGLSAFVALSFVFVSFGSVFFFRI